MFNAHNIQLPETIAKRVDPTYSKQLQARLKRLLNWQSEGFPGSRPITFESKHLRDIEREDYFVTEKADGIRYLLYFVHSPKGPASFLFDRNQVWYYVPNLLFPLRGRENEFLTETLMDGELVLDIDADKKTWRYLIFDLMVVNGSPILQRSFNTRLGMLQQDVIQPFNSNLKLISELNKLPPFTVELKKMERAYGLRVLLDQIPKLKHKSNGIIWIPVKCPYTPGKCNKLLKWKPPESNLANFRISAKWSKEHKPIYSIELLSNGGITYKFYDHFQPDAEIAAVWKNNLPDGRIGEFRYDATCEVTIIEQGYAPTVRKGGWRFVGFKDDNATVIRETAIKQILRNVHHGISKDELLASMDRVRAAWKAREKGLAMPPLSANASLSSSATEPSCQQLPQHLPHTSGIPVNTNSSSPTAKPTAVSKSSPITTAASNDNDDNRDSVQNDNSVISGQNVKPSATFTTQKRKLSQEKKYVRGFTEKSKGDIISSPKDRKKSKSSITEEEQNTIYEASANSTTLYNIPQTSNRESSSASAVLSSPSAAHQHKPDTVACNNISEDLKAKDLNKHITSPTASIQSDKSLNSSNISTFTFGTGNRRSKSISDLINHEVISDTSSSTSSSVNSPRKTKKTRHYSIHNLLVAPSVDDSQELHTSSDQQQHQQPQPQQKQPVQFINYHAEERQSTTNNNRNILIIRSESQSEPSIQIPSSYKHQQQPLQKHVETPNSKLNNSSLKYFNADDEQIKRNYQNDRTSDCTDDTGKYVRLTSLPESQATSDSIFQQQNLEEHLPYQNKHHYRSYGSPTSYVQTPSQSSRSSTLPLSSNIYQHQPIASSGALAHQQQQFSDLSDLQSYDRSAPMPPSHSYQNTHPDYYHRRQQRQNSEQLPAFEYAQNSSQQQRLSLPPTLSQPVTHSPYQSILQPHQLQPQIQSYPVATSKAKRKDSQKAKLDFILN
ncbi:mRNA capping enzyme, catalytic domain-containing protein [Mycotypha africana]|uniref:mRNA capping enzyme, catalytic domain-containing protein n=1 Tax=Mycotypha africana TaxID=64632 RepID=UPI0023012D3E|nr:mRNA capping enzyme, catalytic domain-containing protein [Mycotypha africana]KAI8975621.1 mRNA capping enzyme, catalytic domain-containing protein [Mycotypha africana]